MKDEKEHSLLFHSLHSRPMPGCLPLFMLLAALLLGGAFALVRVKMPDRVRSRGESNVYYRNDSLTHFEIRRRSPLPLRLPASVEPVNAVAASVQPLSAECKVKLHSLEAPPLFGVAPDSVVLDAADLMALPPVSAPTAEENVQPQEGGE